MTFAFAEILGGLLKMHRRRGNPSRHHPIGESRNNIGFESHVGMRADTAASIAGPEAYPPTPITTSGSNSLSMRRACRRRAGRSKNVFSAVFQLTRFERADFDQLQRKSCGRHQTVLNATCRADEEQLSAILFLEFLGDGKGRDYVSAGTAACQNDSMQ